MRDNMRMKKVFSILLCLCMVFSYVPQTVFASEPKATMSYNLWVGGTQVTSANASDVLGSADEGATVTYDAATNTLTLNGASLTGGYGDAVIYSSESLNVVLAAGSANTLSGQNYGIRVEGDVLTVSGTGSLTSTANFDGIQGKSVTISGGSITATGSTSYGIKGTTVAISGGTVTAYGGAHGVEGELTLSGDTHVTITSENNAVNGSLRNSTTGWCRGGDDETFTTTITSPEGNKYFEYIGASHVTYTNKDAQNHTVACAHGISFDAAHEYESGVCVCNAEDPMYGCDFIVTGDTANYSWNKTNKVLTINGGNVTVSNKDRNTATSHRIYIQGTANVTLDGVNISSTTGAPVEIRDYSDTNVTLTLSGSNTLISQAANKAAIHKARGQQGTNSDAATLTINGSGSLTAVGGSNAAGIGGGGYRGDTHNIIINSGTIYATGTGNAAGIGSSDDGSTWNIVINGGNITANGQPGIGANTTNWQGQKNAAITGGTVITNSYVGSTPTGGLVSTDGGKTYTVYSDYTLSQNLTIDPTGKLTVAEGATLTIADGVTLTNKGVLVNYGIISGDLSNEGIIYNIGTLPTGITGTVYEQYVTVNSGSGTGNYAEGSTVTITANAPESGKTFTGWTVELGTVTLTDSTKAETTFTMPEGCVIVTANYADVVATITDANGNVTSYTDDWGAMRAWRENGGTLKLYTDDFYLDMIYMYSDTTAVLDLNGHSCRLGYYIENSVTIKNGTVLVGYRMNIQSNVTATFENVTISPFYATDRTTEISNHGTIVDAGLTLNGVTISGGTIKTGFTDGRVTLVDIPEHGYIYDGTAHEPGVKYGETTLVKGTDYTVTFSNSSGGGSTINAGTVTMTITGIGNYAGTVTRTYTISKATLTVTAENKEITYGDAVPTYTVTYKGFVNGENEDKLGGTLAFVCGYAQFSDKGEYTIKASGYTSDNYIINYVDGKLNVSAKPITVTIQNATSIYGDEIVALTATDNGIVNNDKDVYRLITTASKTADVGKYDIIGEALDGNYSINFEKGTAAYEITTRKLTVSVVVANKKYDGLNTAAITSAVLNNVASNDTVALVNGTATFTSVNVADGIAISLTDFALSGEAEVLKNYTLTQPTGIKANITNDWTPTEYIVSTPNSNGWLNADLVIIAKDGYELSLTNTADGVWSETLTGAVEGADSSITFYVRNKADGTISLAKTVNYKLDKTDPTGTVEFVGREPWQEFVNNITFGLFFKEEVTVKITANDTLSDIANIEYYEADEMLTLDEVKAIKNWTAYNDSFGVSVEDAKKFIYFVRITDNAGNVTYLSTDVAEYDTTDPKITGVENNGIYYVTQKVTVEDKNLNTVTLNDTPVTLDGNGSFTLTGNTEAQYKIVATDKAGRSTIVTVTMKPISSISTPIDNLTKDNVNSGNEQTVDDVKAAVAAVETTNATDAEKQALKDIADKAAELEKVIDDTKAEIARINEELNKYNGATVNSDNAAALEQLAKDIEALTAGGNLTNAERTMLTEDADNVAAMQKTVADTKAENKRISDAVDGYELATVTSADKADLEQLLADINEQLQSTNLTEEEITALNGDKKAVEDLLTKINGTDELIDKLTEDMDGYSEDTVKSTDKDAIKQIIEDIDALLETENLTEAEEKALEDAKTKAEGLLDTIEYAAEATDTENTEKVKDVTAENVTPEDKTDLEKAKEELEKALEDNGGNYTDDEKKAIEDEIQRIDDALEVIENVEAVEAAISDLPETVELDNAETVAKIEEIKRAYDELTDYEKSLVDSETKAKLDMLANAIVAYDIVKGDRSSWTKGTDDSISFTANGPIAKFSGIKIDGKTVDAQHYEVKAGSTIITLKASYLETLAVGEHTITVVYTDGETSGTFTVQAKSFTPATGDDTNILLWTTMLLFSVAAMSVLIVCNNKFAYKAKYVRK